MTILLKSPEAEAYQPLEIQPEPLDLPDNPLGPLPPVPESDTPYYRLHANSEQNGRTRAALPDGDWSLAWEQELRPGFVPEAVLCAGDRLLVETGVWQLFDTRGTLIREGSSGSGGVTLDPEKGVFYHVNKMGDLAGRQLENGEPAFALMPFLGEEFNRALIRRIGDRLLLVGIERQLDPHGHKKAKRTLLEWIGFDDLETLTASGMLASARNTGTLILPSTRTLSAASEAGVFVAAPNRLYVTTPEATIRRAIEGDIQPVALSLGGNGVAYLVARESERLALWCLSDAGSLLRRFYFPDGIQGLVAPPLVGADGRIYLLARGRIIALDGEMATLWESTDLGSVVGATITANGKLLVAGTEKIGIIDEAGKFSAIAGKAESEYCTSPIVTDDGDVVIASRRGLHAYTTRE